MPEYGDPSQGKSQIVRDMAEELGIPVVELGMPDASLPMLSELEELSGPEVKFEVQKDLGCCHDCSAKPGQVHDFGCDVERCSYCGGQRMCCGCEPHDGKFARWTGIWPGFAEALALGISINAIQGHLAVLVHGKPGERLLEPDIDLINSVLPELRKVGHRITEELSDRLHEGFPKIEEEDFEE